MTKFSLLSRGWQLKLVGSVAIVGTLFIAVGESVLAQIVPDNTLGAEGSVVTPNVNIQGIQGDRIDGGATRGANLFHSFQEFNVGEGRGAYFANPTGIENILTRVAGGNPSNILGRLGVLGEANLFLLNPNGILFGSNASLDIQGSFVATTAERIQLGDSGYFSAAQPLPSSLLSVSPGAVFFSEVANQPTSIINQGNLSTGKHLTLRAGNLDLQGQLIAGGDLTLQAQDTVKVRDSVATPFLALSGGNLAIVGKGGIDILALVHPTQTPFVSGGNLAIASDGVISLDASFSSGGSFSIKSISGGLANFFSYYDPIISAEGDVDVVANYTGTSLLVEATGNIRFGGDINITGPNTSTLPPGPDTDTLRTTSALIMRSGQSTLAYGGVNSGAVPNASNGPVPAGITLGGNVIVQPFNGAGGIVNLLAALGDVSTQAITTNGGTIEISSAGAIVTNGKTLDTRNGGNNGGAIAFTAQNNITTGNLYSYSLGAGNGGNITLRSTLGSIDTSTGDLNSASISGNGGEISFTAQNNITTGDLGSFSIGAGNGGKIALLSTHGSIDTSAGILESISDAGNGGEISLTAQNDITTGYLGSFSRSSNGGAIALTAQNNITTGYLGSFSIGAGNGGNITLRSTLGSIDTSAGSLDSISNAGNGGEIALTAQNNITTGDLVSYSLGAGNGGAIRLEANGNITTQTLDASTSSANGGDITLISRNGGINTTGKLNANTRLINSGNGGKITLQAEGDITTTGMRSDGGTFGISGDITITSDTGTILVNGGEINSKNYGTLKGGDINITATAGSIFLRNGVGLNASTEGQGNAGSVNIFAHDTVSFDRSYAVSRVERGSVGNGGDINITTDALSLTNGAQLSASTFGKGDAGSVNINATDTVSFDGSGAFSSVEDTGIGKGGGINITTGSLLLSNGAVLVIRTSGEGDAGSINVNAEQLFLSTNAALIGDVDPNAKGRGGNIDLNVTGTILLAGGNPAGSGESTRITIGVLPDGIGSGGTLNINADALVLTDGAIVKNSTQGQGNAGDINVNARVVDISGSVPSSGLPSGLFTSTDTDGSAGNIVIDTQTFRIADGAALSARSQVDGQGGDITVIANSFEAVNGGQLITTTFGQGQAGNIFVNATDRVTISGSDPNYTNRIAKFPHPISDFVANDIRETGPNSGLFANTETNSTGNGGDIEIVTSNFNLTDSAQISASTSGKGRGGNITVNATQSLDLNQASLLAQSLAQSNDAAPAGSVTINTPNLTARNGTIATSSESSSGGDITITADKIRLYGDSDIITRVNQGTGGGGDIKLTADSIIAFDDSDILTFAPEGTGGNITLDTPAFFGENYNPASSRNDPPASLDGNNRVDVNASGTVNGIIIEPDVSFIQNSLTELPENQINTDSLLANSCIVRRNQPTRGSFTITGTGGLPQRPGDAQMSSYPTVDVETLPSDSTPLNTNPNRPWQKGDPIIEPQGVYRLPNGKLVLSRECS